MSRAARVLIVFSLVVFGLPVLTAAGRAPERSEHQRIVDFWTVERVAQAVPREFAYDPAAGGFRQVHHRPDHGGGPGGGGGGGGGNGNGDQTVTGASWTGGGAVEETTGKVLFELSGSFFVCSAGVVEDTRTGSSLVVTAAHCVYDNEGAGAFATNWMFIPNYRAAPEPLGTQGDFCSQTEHGCWTASALVVHDGFASAGGFTTTAILHDFAFAVLGPGGHDGATLAEDLGDPQGIVFTDVARNTHVHAFGYPHAPPARTTGPTWCTAPAVSGSTTGCSTSPTGSSAT